MSALASDIPGFVPLGHLQLSIYGFFAAAGLVAAVWYSQRMAMRAKLSMDRLWDAGIFAVVTAFVVSRGLLIVNNFAAFKRYPLLLMAQPSLTYSGLLLTVVLTCGWLYWKRMPLLSVADAWAPCGAVLWTVLSVGHFVEGTDAGMPTRLPWGVVTPGDTVLGPTHPVQLYTVVCAGMLAWYLSRKLAVKHRAGSVAALGLMLGGFASFLLGMLRQPAETYGGAWLDTDQWVAVAAMLIGLLLEAPLLRIPMDPGVRMQEFLEDFITLRGHKRVGWIRNTAFTDPLLVEIQKRFLRLPREFPVEASSYNSWCNEDGLQILKWYVYQLHARNEIAAVEESV
ncbi:MAG TPA: prolipoprotein diacylglyceryl transferase family protein [Acidobacteriaceae bacterium]|jgi:phosphatidylglycerol:prolipoprotein diacylglycerol transferase